jgi:hypothetical protein
MILELEQAIATRIREAVSKLTQVVEFPDEPEGLGRPVQRSRIVFGYQRASFRTTADNTQEKTFYFETIFQAKNLRTHQDPCYQLLDAVSMALIGWRPFALATRNIEQTDERFVSFGEGVWIYSQTYSLTVTISEAVREALTEIEDDTLSDEERERRRAEFWRQYMRPIHGVVLPPHITVVCGLWRSLVDKVADPETSQLEAVFKAGGIEDISLGTDDVRE